MDGTFTMPDAAPPLTKELKKDKKKLDSLYSPFLMKFFGPTGVLVKAFDKIMTDTVMVQLIQLIRIVDALYSKATGQWKKDEKDKKEEAPDGKKKHWITEKWQKVIKSNFFQKTMGFLKSMATTNFITTLLTFLVLLKMGILQRFIPFIISVVGDAVQSLIGFLPQLAKMFWKILTETAPKIFSEIFRTIFKTLGIENETLLKFSDGLAKILPMLLTGLWLFDKISAVLPVFTIIGKVFSFLLWVVKAIWFVIEMIAFVTGIAVGWVVAIIAAVILIGVLVWKFRKEIWDFLKWIGNAFYDYVIAPITAIFVVLGSLFYDFVIKPIWDALVWVSGLFYKYIMKPVGKAISWVMKKFVALITSFIGIFKKAFKWIGDLLYKIFVAPIKSLFSALAAVAAPVIEKIQPIINFIKGIFDTVQGKAKWLLDSISETVKGIFQWFGGASAFGGYDWGRNISSGQQSEFLAKKAQLESNIYIQKAQEGKSLQQAKDEGVRFTDAQAKAYERMLEFKKENKDADLVDIMAAQSTGILEFLDGIKNSTENQNRAKDALNFFGSDTNTKSNTTKPTT
jgi:hypothetical protein